MIKKRILILGKNGMLGSTLFRLFSVDERFETFGTARTKKEVFDKNVLQFDANNANEFNEVLRVTEPDVVINCIGLINKRGKIGIFEEAKKINGELPHLLAKMCCDRRARFIHFSTDCVFSGKKGNYTEEDLPDPEDWYGETKLAGEVNLPGAVTIRTSFIGPEQDNKYGLLEWFLSQKDEVCGFTKAIFSGFPTFEMAFILANYIIPRIEISGLFHVSSGPISKYDLLKLVAKRYNKDIKIRPVDKLKIDRSLDSTKFRQLVGYQPLSWDELINKMYIDHIKTR